MTEQIEMHICRNTMYNDIEICAAQKQNHRPPRQGDAAAPPPRPCGPPGGAGHLRYVRRQVPPTLLLPPRTSGLRARRAWTRWESWPPPRTSQLW